MTLVGVLRGPFKVHKGGMKMLKKLIFILLVVSIIGQIIILFGLNILFQEIQHVQQGQPTEHITIQPVPKGKNIHL